MPRYDFVCHNVEGHKSGKPVLKEFTLKMSESSDPQVCPICGGEMKRKFHPVRRVYRKHEGQFLHPDMNSQQAEDAMYEQIVETND